MEQGNSENIDDQDTRASELKRQQDFDNFDVEDFLNRSSPLRTPRKRNLFTGEHTFLFMTNNWLSGSRGHPLRAPPPPHPRHPIRTKFHAVKSYVCLPRGLPPCGESWIRLR